MIPKNKMKSNSLDRIKKRLVKDAPTASVSMRLPERMIEELKEIAAASRFSSYRAVIRFYLSQGMRADLEKIDTSATDQKRAVRMPTKKEDAAIRAAAKADPDAQPLTKAQLAAMVPLKSIRN